MSRIDALKARAQFFKRGAIVPRRVNAVTPRRLQHRLTFGADTWVVPGPHGYVCFAHYVYPGQSAMRLKAGLGKIRRMQGAPYHVARDENAGAHFVQDFRGTPEQFEANVFSSLAPCLEVAP